MTTDPVASERPAGVEHEQARVNEASDAEKEPISEKVSRSVHSEDPPLGDQVPEAPFALVALGYMGVAALVMLVVALVLMTL